MFQLSTKPQSIGKVLDESIRLFFASFKSVFLLSLIGCMAVISPNFIMSDFVALAQSGDPSQAQGMLGQFFAVLAIGMLVFLVFYNAMYYRINKISHGQESGTGESVAVGIKKLIPVIVAVILFSIAMVFGLLLLIIPGVILMLSMFFYQPLVVCDNLGPIAALKTSHNLVWGNWWRTATVFLVPFFILMALWFLAVMVAGIVIGANGEFDAGPGAAMSTANKVTYGTMMLFYIIIYPYMSAMMLVQLNDLKLRKQGMDLEARVAAR